MLYAGQEFGEDTPRTIDFQPLHWDKLDQPSYHAYFQIIKRLLAARRTHPALSSDHIRFYPDDFVREQMVRYDRFLCHEHKTEPADFVAVALNFSGEPRETELTVSCPGAWQDLLSEASYSVAQTCRLTLAPWQAVVLVRIG
ncbi:MAG: DUF3459 domain-containing protein [Caldilineaceae bacterium]